MENEESILKEVTEFGRDIAMMKAQITAAVEANKFLDEPIDSDWFRNVNYALSMKKYDLSVLNKKVDELNKISAHEMKLRYQKKQQTIFESCFVDIAKETLDSDLFKEIISAAKKLQFARKNKVNIPKIEKE
ncbi:hypothetical protein [Radiobacillus sp. PE A8.2]|uniref:hypothetical protein n=1 Tax=Radiobacillus sp. PE A8.2 TaxID=3380349 RepID=UPI00388E8A3B